MAVENIIEGPVLPDLGESEVKDLESKDLAKLVEEGKKSPDQVEKRRVMRKSGPAKKAKAREVADCLASPGQKFELDEKSGKLSMALKVEELPESAPGKKIGVEDVLPKDVRTFDLAMKDEKGEVRGKLKVESEVRDGKVSYFFSDESGSKKFLSQFELPQNGIIEVEAQLAKKEEHSAEKVADTMTKQAKRSVTEFSAAVRKSSDHEISSGLMAEKPRSFFGRLFGRGEKVPGKLPEIRSEGEVMRAGSRILENPVDDKAKAMLAEFNSDEALENYADPVTGNTWRLRKTALKCLKYATELANADGLHIAPYSAYRSKAEQTVIWNRKKRKNNRMVATPGHSNHQLGGTLDCHLMDLKTKRVLKSTDAYARLSYYMNRAGFVRYEPEEWHFEIGSKESAALVLSKIPGAKVAASEGLTYSRLA